MTTIEFTVPGEVVPWARSGGGRSVARFTPARQRNYMAVLKDYGATAMNGTAPLDCPVELSVLAIYPWPKSWSTKKRTAPGAEWKTSRPDSDNIVKIIKDSLNKIAFTDDAVVASQHVWKRYGEVPLVKIKIARLA